MGRSRRAPRLSVIVDAPAVEGLGRRVLDALRPACDAGVAEVLIASRNAALGKARGDVMLFIDGQSIPHPDLPAYVMDFHERRPAVESVVTMGRTIDWMSRHDPILAWRWRARYAPDAPSEPGVYAWPQFRIGVLSCKRALIGNDRFDARFTAGGDLHLAARLARRAAIRVFYEGVTLATVQTSPSLDDALAAEYRDGYDRRLRVLDDEHARVAGDAADRFAFADAFVLPPEQEAAVRATIESLAPSVADTTVHADDTAARLALFEQSCTLVFDHHAARGWLAAFQF